LKIWFDILTPKQILFFEPMIKQLQKSNQILCTSRNYREVTHLAKLRKMKIVLIGKHGGQSKIDKLSASLSRMTALTRQIQKFKPDLTISFCSPEAARISFGLGIRHVAFCDSPHAEAVMRLSIPFVQKLLIPWIIPKNEFTKYGIDAKNIIPYKAIDASVIVKNTSTKKTGLRKKGGKKNILIRVEEAQAAYVQKKQSQILPIIKEIAKKFSNENVLVLPRYRSQIVTLRQTLGSKVKILDKVVVGKTLLQNTDVFVGSGGTMTAEAALLGIPTISYDAVPNLVQDYLVRKRLVMRESNPKKIVSIIEKMLRGDNKYLQANAKKTLASMEDPLKKLIYAIKMR
jgi:predicted glycosyltransferase